MVCISVKSLFMWLGVLVCENVMSSLMYVIIPPPLLPLSVLIGTKLSSLGVLCCGCNLDSWMVIMSMSCFCAVCSSSVVFFVRPLVFSWRIFRVCFFFGVFGLVCVCWGGLGAFAWLGHVHVCVYSWSLMATHLMCSQWSCVVLQRMLVWVLLISFVHTLQ